MNLPNLPERPTTIQLARYLRVSPNDIRTNEDYKKLNYSIGYNKQRMYWKEEVEDLLESFNGN